jgi:hypothetical protein
MFLGGSAFARPADKPMIKSCTPKPGEVLNNARPIITAKFFTKVETSTVVFAVDGTPVSAASGNLSINPDSVSYLPLQKLSEGIHKLKITANKGEGSWSFIVKAPKLATTRVSLKWIDKSIGLCEAVYKVTNSGTGCANDVASYGITSKTAGVFVLTKNVFIADEIKPSKSAAFKVRYYVPKISGAINITVPVDCCDDGGNEY